MLFPSFIKNNLTKMIPRCRKIAHSKISPGLYHIFQYYVVTVPSNTHVSSVIRVWSLDSIFQLMCIRYYQFWRLHSPYKKKLSHLHLMKQYIKWKYLSSSIVWASSNVVLFDNIWYEIRAEKLGQIIFLWAKSELLHSC